MVNNPVRFNDPLGDTIVVDYRGYITQRYGTDNLVFLQGKKGLNQIGELGKQIYGNKIFKNLLNSNIERAKNSFSPFKFRNLVKGKVEWDLKNNKNTIYGLANQFGKGKENKTQFSFEGAKYTAEELGNIHFGAVGKAWNFFAFTEDFLLQQAGEAQVAAGTSLPEWQKFTIRRVPMERGFMDMKFPATPYGDDPRDQEMIKRGFKYFDQNKNNTKEED
jgi:hypothetical protein